MQPAERYHSLDSLRALMMFLGILLHGMLSFTEMPVPFWPAHDDERSPVNDFFIFLVHAFRMQTFFFLAGFFGALLVERYGVGGMFRHRFLRIVIPFVLGLIFIQPTLQVFWIIGNVTSIGSPPVVLDTSVSERLRDHFCSGRFIEYIHPYHMWFLYYLLYFFVAMIPLVYLGRCLAATRLGRGFDRIIQRLFVLPGKTVILALPTTLLLWPMMVWGMSDTPFGWKPLFHLLGYYFYFFLLGWLLWRHRDLLPSFRRRWVYALVIGQIVVLPIMLKLIFGVVERLIKKEGELPGFGYQLATNFAGALYTWLTLGGLLGLFQSCFSRERPWVRYLSDASYWCYLWHLTPIIALQIALSHAPLPGLLKFAIVIGVSMTLLLVTYEYCVRYTFIGGILNGRKFRKPRDGRAGAL